jgi:hypothetical protein
VSFHYRYRYFNHKGVLLVLEFCKTKLDGLITIDECIRILMRIFDTGAFMWYVLHGLSYEFVNLGHRKGFESRSISRFFKKCCNQLYTIGILDKILFRF